MAAYISATESVDFEKQKQLMTKVFDIAAENLWSINIATSPPELVVVQQDLHNVPKMALTGDAVAMPSNTGIETYFFGHPSDSPVLSSRRAIPFSTPSAGPVSVTKPETTHSFATSGFAQSPRCF